MNNNNNNNKIKQTEQNLEKNPREELVTVYGTTNNGKRVKVISKRKAHKTSE